MAITIVTSVVGTQVGGTGTLALNLGSTEENDVVVVWGGFAGGTATAPGVTTPGDFSSIWTTDSAALDTKLEWKRLGSTPDTSVLAARSGDAADAVGYTAFVLRGVSTDADPFDVTYISSVAVGSPQAPSIITSTDGAVVLAFGANDVNDNSPGVVSNMDANVGGSSNDTDDFTVAGAASVIATAGAFSPNGWSTWTSGNYNTATIVLKPFVEAGGGGEPYQSFAGVWAGSLPGSGQNDTYSFMY